MPLAQSAGGAIHVFGDSFVFGQGVGDAETALHVLAARRGVRILNYGVMGYGLEQMLGRLQAADVRPGDTVVFAPVADDFRRNLIHRAHACLFRIAPPRLVRVLPVLQDDGRLKPVAIDAACGVAETIVLSATALPLGIAFNRLRNRAVDPASIAHSRAVIAAAAAAAKARGAAFRLIVLVSGAECAAGRLQLDLRDLGVPYETMLPSCPADAAAIAALRFASDYHWSPAGHRWAATVLERLLFGGES
jgi:hypothetical protein